MTNTMTTADVRARYGELRTEVEDEVDFVDFSYNPKPVGFVIDDRRYRCKPVLPVTTLAELAGVLRGGGLVDAARGGMDLEKIRALLDQLAGIFNLLLEDESAEAFNDRLLLRKPDAKPLDLVHQVMPIVRHVTSKLGGGRPPERSSSSSAGFDDETGGTSSTAGPPSTG